MLSRVAENIYWMARYIERAENVSRLVRVNTNLMLDLPRGIQPDWMPLITIVGMDEEFAHHYKEATERNVVKFLIHDPDNPGSILSALRAARENCRTVRDVIPRSGWEELNELYLFAKEHVNEGLTRKGRFDFLKEIVNGSQMLNGMLDSVMVHDEAFHFLNIGRNLERADMTTRIIDVRSTDLLPEETPELPTFDTIQWMSVLISLSAYQMYRRHVQVQVSRPAILDFLMKSSRFPRAVNHCLQHVRWNLRELPSHEQALDSVRKLQRSVKRRNLGKMSRDELHAFIDRLQLQLIKVHNQLAETYFLPPPATLVAV